MTKDKLACETIFLNVLDFLLHHVTDAANAKDAWDNLVQHLREEDAWDNLVQHLREDILAVDHNYIKSFPILRWKKTLQCKFILISFK
jgi:hypothetical protein